MSLFQLKKRTNERFAVGLKFVAPDLAIDESIISVEPRIEPNEAGGLTMLGEPSIERYDTVSQMVADGIDGHEYDVIFKVTTSAGNIFEEGIQVSVRDI